MQVTFGLVDQLCKMATDFARIADEPRYVVPSISRSPLTLSELRASLRYTAEAESWQAQDTVSELDRAAQFEEVAFEDDRSRGIWASPAYRFRRRALSRYRAGDTRVDLCSKGAPTSAKFMPGLLVIACPHGYIYYLQIMRGAESPAMVLDFLYDRCRPECLPSRVCYDNVCNAHAYVAARRPELCTIIQWIIDRFHARNHVHCSIAYQIDRFTIHNSRLDFNTQRVEQLNRMLRRLATHLRFSKPDNAIDALRIFMLVFAYRRQLESCVSYQIHGAAESGGLSASALLAESDSDDDDTDASDDLAELAALLLQLAPSAPI